MKNQSPSQQFQNTNGQRPPLFNHQTFSPHEGSEGQPNLQTLTVQPNNNPINMATPSNNHSFSQQQQQGTNIQSPPSNQISLFQKQPQNFANIPPISVSNPKTNDGLDLQHAPFIPARYPQQPSHLVSQQQQNQLQNQALSQQNQFHQGSQTFQHSALHPTHPPQFPKFIEKSCGVIYVTEQLKLSKYGVLLCNIFSTLVSLTGMSISLICLIYAKELFDGSFFDSYIFTASLVLKFNMIILYLIFSAFTSFFCLYLSYLTWVSNERADCTHYFALSFALAATATGVTNYLQFGSNFPTCTASSTLCNYMNIHALYIQGLLPICIVPLVLLIIVQICLCKLRLHFPKSNSNQKQLPLQYIPNNLPQQPLPETDNKQASAQAIVRNLLNQPPPTLNISLKPDGQVKNKYEDRKINFNGSNGGSYGAGGVSFDGNNNYKDHNNHEREGLTSTTANNNNERGGLAAATTTINNNFGGQLSQSMNTSGLNNSASFFVRDAQTKQHQKGVNIDDIDLSYSNHEDGQIRGSDLQKRKFKKNPIPEETAQIWASDNSGAQLRKIPQYSLAKPPQLISTQDPQVDQVLDKVHSMVNNKVQNHLNELMKQDRI